MSGNEGRERDSSQELILPPVKIAVFCEDEDIRPLISKSAFDLEIEVRLNPLKSVSQIFRLKHKEADMIIADLAHENDSVELGEFLYQGFGEGFTILVLCSNDQVARFQRLMSEELIADYMIVRPLIDPGRMPLLIKTCAERCRLRHLISKAETQASGRETGARAIANTGQHSPLAMFGKVVELARTSEDFMAILQVAGEILEEHRETSQEGEPRPPEQHQTNEPLLPQKQILIIEDDPPTAMLTEDILKAEGARVYLAKSYEQGASRHREKIFDLLVCDLMVPGVGGADGIRYLKSQMDFPDVPILVFSAHSHSELAEELFHLGIKGFLVKPFKRRIMLAKVCEALDMPVPPEMDDA